MRFKRAAAGLIASVMALTALISPFTSAAAEGIFPEPVTGETENNNVVTATADDSGLVYGDNGTLTKAEWLHDLVTVFDMKVEEGDPPDNYFTDVAYDSEYYDDIMLATEFGVVNVEAGGELGPDDTVDREYASVTLNFCLGFQLDDDTYTFSESSDEAYADELTAFQVALNRNWFALSGGAFLPSKAITSAEAKAMLSDAQQVLADAQIDDTKEGTFEFADYVIDFTPYQVVEFNEDDTVTIYAPDKALAVGDTFVVYDQELPFVYTATAIKTDGSDIIVTTTDAPDDAIVNYVAEGTIKADIATFNPADNVDVTYVKDDVTALTMSKARGVTVTKDSIMVDMKIPISSGIDVSVSCDLKNIALHHKEDKWNGYYYASVTGDTTLTTSLNMDPLKGSGVSGKYYLGYISTGVFSASLYAELSLSGKLMTVYTGNFEVGVSYQRFKGFRVIKSFTKKSFNFCADISAKVAMTAECKIDLLLLEAKASVSVGIQAKYNKKVYGDDKLPGICEDIQAYLYAGGSISATIIKVATFSKSFDFIDKNNSPYRLYLHYDDGNQVDVCGRDISDPSSPTPVRRYTSPSSTGFGSRWSSSQSSKWHSGSNGSSAQQPEKLWEYSLDDDKNATITAYNGYSSSLVIPTKIDGYTVTAIGDSAFANNTRLVMVVIPDSVTEIGAWAFSGCKNLSSVTLSKGVVDLQLKAFSECTKLTSIIIPKSLEKCDGAFSGNGPFYKSGLSEVKFENGIKAIPDYLFAGATALETIAIPDTVTSVGNYSFSNCTVLKNVTIPDSVTNIKNGAFYECTALETITIPDSVTEIGAWAFSGCKNLSSVTLSKGVVDLQLKAFSECTKLTSIIIPKSLEKCDGAFSGNGPFYKSGLSEVKFENGIKAIPDYLFAGATALETIVIPDTVASIGSYSFSECSALKNVTIPDSVTNIKNGAFYECTSLETITIPDSVTEIGAWAFSGCKNLSSVTLSKGVVDLQLKAFSECTKLTSIIIPKSLEKCDGAFSGNGPFYKSGLSEVKFENGIKAIPDYLFAGATALETIAIPDTVTSVGNYSFSNCTVLKNVTIPDSVTNIKNGAFYECTALETITIPDSVTEIGAWAFSGCKNLSSVTLSKGVVDLQLKAFSECTKLTSIIIPKSLEKCDGAFSGNGPFYKSGLSEVKFENGIKAIPDYLFAGATALETIVIPDTVASIGSYSFSECSALKNVTIPDSVTNIKNGAFNECTLLETITLPESIKTLGDYAFDGCVLLYAIKFPSLLTEIGRRMCNDCTSLVTVEMGDKVTSIGDNAFQNCTSLKNITLAPETEYINSNAFSNCDALENIVIPDKVTAIYNNAFSDCDKLSSVTLSKTLRSIDSNAFNNCDSLTAIKIPDSVETIGERAFYHCEKLADVDMGNGVSKLYSEAFRLCPALTKIVLSNNLTSIPEYAFADCTKLTDVTIYPGVTEIATNAFSYPAKTTMRGLKGSYAETYANDRGMTFEAITSVDVSMLTVKFKNDYDEYENAPSYTYTGKPFKPDVKVYLGSYELTAGTDYKIVSYKDNTKIGTATCTIQGLGTYTGTTTGSFTIAAIPLPGYSWYYSLEYSDYDYTGKEIKPAVTCDGLTEGTDFTVSYKDNINAGTAQVIITGIGNYSGTYTLEFTINPVTICTDVSQLQSKHPYDGNIHDVYVYNGAEGAKNLYLAFSDDTQFEEYSDYLYIYDANEEAVGTYTGDELSGKTITVPGNYVKLVLNTDSSNNEYGFRVVSVTDSIECTTHTFGDWVITEEPTCTTTGTQTRTCSVCKKVEIATIAKVAHKYVNTVVKPTYTAQGYTLHKCSVCGTSYKDTYTAKLTLAKVTGVKLGGRAADALRVNWTKNANASGYIVEMYQGNKWVRVAKITSNSTTTFRKAGLSASTVYKFRVRAYKMEGKAVAYGAYSTELAARTNPSVMTGAKLTGRAADALRINWTKNASADGYIVEMYLGNKWVRVAKITNNSTTTVRKAGLKASSVYKFRVRAYKMSGKTALYGNYSATVTARTNPSVVKGVKIGGKAKDALRVNWTKNASAQGYIVEMYKGGKWVRVAKITNGNTTTFRKFGLAKNTAYKFRVCAYYMSGKTALYGNYGSVSGKTAVK